MNGPRHGFSQRSHTDMSTSQRPSVWFGRFVLGGAALLLTRISFGYIADPIGTVAPHEITLGSAEAVTIMRVSGGVFLGFAMVLVGCLWSERRLLVGLGCLTTIAGAILTMRLLGLAVDGPAPFTLRVLKPEVALVLLSAAALFVERRRLSAAGAQ